MEITVKCSMLIFKCGYLLFILSEGGDLLFLLSEGGDLFFLLSEGGDLFFLLSEGGDLLFLLSGAGDLLFLLSEGINEQFSINITESDKQCYPTLHCQHNFALTTLYDSTFT